MWYFCQVKSGSGDLVREVDDLYKLHLLGMLHSVSFPTFMANVDLIFFSLTLTFCLFQYARVKDDMLGSHLVCSLIILIIICIAEVIIIPGWVTHIIIIPGRVAHIIIIPGWVTHIIIIPGYSHITDRIFNIFSAKHKYLFLIRFIDILNQGYILRMKWEFR